MQQAEHIRFFAQGDDRLSSIGVRHHLFNVHTVQRALREERARIGIIESADLKAWAMPNFDPGHYFAQISFSPIASGRSLSEMALLSHASKHDD